MKLLSSVTATILILAAAASCGKEPVNRYPPRGQGRSDEPADGSVEEHVETVHVIACGIEVGEGCDWRTDSILSERNTHAFLFEDTLRIRHLTSGDKGKIGLDADDHYILDGELFTSYTDGKSTTIKAGGRTVISFDGKEKITDIFMLGRDIYTTGLLRGGGFCLRCNGKTLLRQTSGVPGPLYADHGEFGFSYKSGGNLYACRSEKQESVAPPLGYEALAARYIGGRLFSAFLSGNKLQVFEGQEMVRELLLTGCTGPKVAEFKDVSDDFALYLKCSTVKYPAVLCMRREGQVSCTGPGDIFAFSDDDADFFAIQLSDNILVTSRKSGTVSVNGGWTLLSEKCLVARDGHVALALSPPKGGTAAIWLDGELYDLGVNGYLTGISLAIL